MSIPSTDPYLAAPEPQGPAAASASDTLSNTSNDPYRNGSSMQGGSGGGGAGGTTSAAAAPASNRKTLISQLGVDPVTGVETTLSLFAFDAENPDELTFAANELIIIIEKDQEYNDGWYRGKNQKGEEGLFPSSYILPEGADPAPYLEMQQAPQPLNIGGGTGIAGNPTSSSLGNGSVGNVDNQATPTMQSKDAANERPPSPSKSTRRASSIAEGPVGQQEPVIPPVTADETVPQVQTATANEMAKVEIPPVDTVPSVKPLEDQPNDPSKDVNVAGLAAAAAAASGAGALAANAVTPTKAPAQSEDEGDQTLKETATPKTDSKTPADVTTAQNVDEDDGDVLGGRNNIRARLAEQARLENAKKEMKRNQSQHALEHGSSREGGSSNGLGNNRTSGVRMSGSGAVGFAHGLVYSDESDSDDDQGTGIASPKANRRLGWNEEEDSPDIGNGFGFARFGSLRGKDKNDELASKQALEPSADIKVPPVETVQSTTLTEQYGNSVSAPATANQHVRASARDSTAFKNVVVTSAEIPPVEPHAATVIQTPEVKAAASPALPNSAPVVASTPASQGMVAPVTPKEQSKTGAIPGGSPSEWGVDEVVAWARSKGFDAAICEKFAGEYEVMYAKCNKRI